MNTTAIARLAAILSPVAAAVAAALAIGVTGATGTAATPSANSGGTPAVQPAETGTREHWYYDYTTAPVVQGDDVGNVPGTNCRDCVRNALEAYAYGQLGMPAGDGYAYYDAYCANGADGGASGANENNGVWSGPVAEDPSVDDPEYAAGLWGYGAPCPGDALTIGVQEFFRGGVCSRLSLECYDAYGYCNFQQATIPCDNEPAFDALDAYMTATGATLTEAMLHLHVYNFGDLYDADGDEYCDTQGDGMYVCPNVLADGGLAGVYCPFGTCQDVDGTDCDDTDGAINPAATELCDDSVNDEDCDTYYDDDDSSVDDATRSDFYIDTDGDNYGVIGSAAFRFCVAPNGYGEFTDDCQDGDEYIYPGAPEICDNVGVDNDCSQGGTGADKTAIDMVRYYYDGDNDGYGTGSGLLACAAPLGYSAANGDCNDSDGTISPGTAEVCDGIDNDCDMYTDEGFTDYDADGSADCVDTDDDNDGDPDTTDCNDNNADVYTGALENCANIAVDNDCDSDTSFEEAVDSIDYFADGDNDNYGTGTAFKQCTDDSTRAPVDGDCDDTNAAFNPGAAEICDGYDNNCVDGIDEDFPDFDEDGDADCVDTDIDGDG